ncbi:MAG: ABC transporter ATP-binding protein [Pseudomonadota bacterium]
MGNVQIDGVVKRFGATDVLKSVSLDIHDGEFLTLIGASGCGKSTLLRVISGLEAQNDGTIRINGRPVDHLRPKDRRIAMVFQSYALYPQMTVAQNMATPLEIDRLTLAERMPLIRHLSPRRRRLGAEIDAAVRATAQQLQIEALLERRPSALSGGQRQRVALGRAMVRDPDVFLMDEPLSNLDASLRVHMRRELAALHAKLGATFVYVTHDQVEAMTMSDRVALMEAGEILQVGTPDALYHRPNSARVAAFLGSPRINLLPAEVDGAGTVSLFGVALATARPGTVATVGLRPEAIAFAPGGLTGRVVGTEDLGHEAILQVAVGEAVLTMRAGVDAIAAARAKGWLGETASLALDPARALLFDGGGARVDAEPAPAAAAE